MLERTRSIGGRLRILPNAPRGTVVELSLPGADAYLDPGHGFIHSIWYRLFRRKRSR
jgi:hypothetical protein